MINIVGDMMLFSNFGVGVMVVGGNFFVFNVNGFFIVLGGVMVMVIDVSGIIMCSILLMSRMVGSFLGFVFIFGVILFIVLLNIVVVGVLIWFSVDNLMFFVVVLVLEFVIYGLMVVGLGLMGFVVCCCCCV